MKVYLVGGTGFAAEIGEALVAQSGGGLESIGGLYDDDTRVKRNPPLGLPYLGTIGDLLDRPPVDGRFILALPENPEREQVASEFDRVGLRALSVVHPSAAVSPLATVGDGAYVAAFSFVGPRAIIGDHAILNVSCSVGYGARLERCAQLSPGVRVSRLCQVGLGAFLGSNAVVAPALVVGDHAKVGAGSFVYRDVPPGKFVMGVPAKLVN